MAILKRIKLNAQQRLELEDFNTMLSAACEDAKRYNRNLLTDEKKIIRGFETTADTEDATKVRIEVNNSMLLNTKGDQTSWFAGPVSGPNAVTIEPNYDTTTKIAESFISLRVSYADSDTANRVFWVPDSSGAGTGKEVINTTTTTNEIQLTPILESGAFSSNLNDIPIAKIFTKDKGGNRSIVGILDYRDLFFSLPHSTKTTVDGLEALRIPAETRVTLNTKFSNISKGDILSYTKSDNIRSTVYTAKVNNLYTVNAKQVLGLTLVQEKSALTFLSKLSHGTENKTDEILNITEEFNKGDKQISNIYQMVNTIALELKELKGTDFWYELGTNSTNKINNLFNSRIVNNEAAQTPTMFVKNDKLQITDNKPNNRLNNDSMYNIRFWDRTSELRLTRQVPGNGIIIVKLVGGTPESGSFGIVYKRITTTITIGTNDTPQAIQDAWNGDTKRPEADHVTISGNDLEGGLTFTFNDLGTRGGFTIVNDVLTPEAGGEAITAVATTVNIGNTNDFSIQFDLEDILYVQIPDDKNKSVTYTNLADPTNTTEDKTNKYYVVPLGEFVENKQNYWLAFRGKDGKVYQRQVGAPGTGSGTGTGVTDALIRNIGFDDEDSSAKYDSNIRGERTDDLVTRLGVLTDAVGDEQQNRSAYLHSNGSVTWRVTDAGLGTITAKSDIFFTIINAKTTPSTINYRINLGSVIIADGEIAYVDLTDAPDDTSSSNEGGKVVRKVVDLETASSGSLAIQTQSSKDIFPIFQRIDGTVDDVTGGAEFKRLHIPLHKQVVEEGEVFILGTTGTGTRKLGAPLQQFKATLKTRKGLVTETSKFQYSSNFVPVSIDAVDSDNVGDKIQKVTGSYNSTITELNGFRLTEDVLSNLLASHNIAVTDLPDDEDISLRLVLGKPTNRYDFTTDTSNWSTNNITFSKISNSANKSYSSLEGATFVTGSGDPKIFPEEDCYIVLAGGRLLVVGTEKVPSSNGAYYPVLLESGSNNVFSSGNFGITWNPDARQLYILKNLIYSEKSKAVIYRYTVEYGTGSTGLEITGLPFIRVGDRAATNGLFYADGKVYLIAESPGPGFIYLSRDLSLPIYSTKYHEIYLTNQSRQRFGSLAYFKGKMWHIQEGDVAYQIESTELNVGRGSTSDVRSFNIDVGTNIFASNKSMLSIKNGTSSSPGIRIARLTNRAIPDVDIFAYSPTRKVTSENKSLIDLKIEAKRKDIKTSPINEPFMLFIQIMDYDNYKRISNRTNKSIWDSSINGITFVDYYNDPDLRSYIAISEDADQIITTDGRTKVDNATIEYDDPGISGKLRVAAGGIHIKELGDDVTSKLSGGGDGRIVQVDGKTIEYANIDDEQKLQIKDLGVDSAQLKEASVIESKVPDGELPLDKINIEAASEGQIPKIIRNSQGTGNTLTWRNESGGGAKPDTDDKTITYNNEILEVVSKVPNSDTGIKAEKLDAETGNDGKILVGKTDGTVVWEDQEEGGSSSTADVAIGAKYFDLQATVSAISPNELTLTLNENIPVDHLYPGIPLVFTGSNETAEESWAAGKYGIVKSLDAGTSSKYINTSIATTKQASGLYSGTITNPSSTIINQLVYDPQNGDVTLYVDQSALNDALGTSTPKSLRITIKGQTTNLPIFAANTYRGRITPGRENSTNLDISLVALKGHYGTLTLKRPVPSLAVGEKLYRIDPVTNYATIGHEDSGPNAMIKRSTIGRIVDTKISEAVPVIEDITPDDLATDGTPETNKIVAIESDTSKFSFIDLPAQVDITGKVDKTRTPNVDIHYGTSVKPATTKVTENDADIHSASGNGFGVVFNLSVDYGSLVGNYFHRSNSVGLGRTYLEIVRDSTGGNSAAGTLVLKWGDNADTLTFPSNSILRRATPGKLLSAEEYKAVRSLVDNNTNWFVYEKETDTQEASLLIELKEAEHGNTKVVRYIETDVITQVKRIFDVEFPNTDDKVDKSEVEMPLLYGKSKRAPAKQISFKGASLSYASGEASLTLHFNGSQNLSDAIGDYLYNPSVVGLGTKFIKLKSIVSGNNTSAVKVTLSWDENADTSLIDQLTLKSSNPGTDFSEAEYTFLATSFTGTRTNANKTQQSNTWSIYEDVVGEEEADLTWDFKSHVERNEAGKVQQIP